MRHSPYTAVYDANVLYPAPLRDFLMRLALTGAYRARWSAQIHDEWKRNLLMKRPDLTVDQVNRTSALMDRAIPDAPFNLKDFPQAALDSWGIEALHPDEFIVDLWDLDQAAVVEAAQRQRASLKNPPHTVREYLDKLLQQKLPETVKLLSHFEYVL
ncbi:PIN domain-containing protein [Pseudomonas sp. Pdm06]|uniref:PIN domain-containing protein n=1 Tax=Pseudomonas sp. Pdm06 TaxID=1790044 RepID=UPI00177C2A47|nr:PIN domain-containing protein [Pseudomonas sp. Pdm06]MBD9466542.1 PIN domain-containing protein [Pseudomonas sp. Pdm06]